MTFGLGSYVDTFNETEDDGASSLAALISFTPVAIVLRLTVRTTPRTTRYPLNELVKIVGASRKLMTLLRSRYRHLSGEIDFGNYELDLVIKPILKPGTPQMPLEAIECPGMRSIHDLANDIQKVCAESLARNKEGPATADSHKEALVPVYDFLRICSDAQAKIFIYSSDDIQSGEEIVVPASGAIPYIEIQEPNPCRSVIAKVHGHVNGGLLVGDQSSPIPYSIVEVIDASPSDVLAKFPVGSVIEFNASDMKDCNMSIFTNVLISSITRSHLGPDLVEQAEN